MSLRHSIGKDGIRIKTVVETKAVARVGKEGIYSMIVLPCNGKGLTN